MLCATLTAIGFSITAPACLSDNRAPDLLATTLVAQRQAIYGCPVGNSMKYSRYLLAQPFPIQRKPF